MTQTKYLGEVVVAEENIIHFSNGLPGFINEKQFTLMELPGNPVFKILQSMSTPTLAFIVTDPYHFYQDYTFELDDIILESLNITSEKDVTVLTIITLTKPFEDSTINLKAPVVINVKTKQGKQYILNDDNYITKASIAPVKTNQVKGEREC